MDELDEIILGVGLTPTPERRANLKKYMQQRGMVVNTAGKLSPTGNRSQELIDLKIQMYRDAGIVTSQSYLRAEAPLNTGQNVINWNVQANGKNTTSGENIATQVLLEQNDTFTVTGMALYLKQADRTAGSNPTDAQHAYAKLLTFPNPQVFTGANEARNLQSIYNGNFKIALDTLTFTPVFPGLAMYRVPQAQQGVGTATGVVGVQSDEWPLPMYGKIDVKPSFEFSGQTQVSILENLNASLDLASPTATKKNYAVLILTGLLHSGANAEFQARMKRAQKG